MTPGSRTHLVLIPSYNTGPKLFDTVRDACRSWNPVWVVIDGSTDGSGEALRVMVATEPGLVVLMLPHNQGKGAAILHGLSLARTLGFTHALTMDADGQHAACHIPDFMAASTANPEAMILGVPEFDASAPPLRVWGRKISNLWVGLETLGAGIGDALFGFRVYPIAPLCAVMDSTHWMRRFDFDTEAVVRLSWRGVPPVNLSAPVRYFRSEEGGVTHFNYARDNLLLAWLHFRLCLGFVLRLPLLLGRQLRSLRR